ncbi:hypothetical protein [Arsenophonus endosymbiont of Bemisia tabaci]|uniref:hypothetical protein n=1 Tax=Arsenophonus endosymbiont of Bemisia tabaci TaxID=536059 RepID=UPI0015F36955|nr:hypothetical protein [Arsenophonus endosymbiont of Bemisia tabaci]CAA2931007.1 hypothetical protein ARSQ2_02154 [Arsenophonus endosymbiont of Bemisia tabaci Q2]
MSNINEFYEYPERLFGLLYNIFPQPQSLYVYDIADLIDTKEAAKIIKTKSKKVVYAVKWLYQYGYISLDITHTGAFNDIFLTKKILYLLTLKSDDSSLGDKIIKAT